MATCSHGLEAGSCLICTTLGNGTTTLAASTPTPVGRRKRGGQAIPAGPAEVLGDNRRRPRRTGGIGLVAWLVILVVAALAGWWILGLIWAVLRIVEVIAVGLVCGYVGFKLGVVSGRHQRKA